MFRSLDILKHLPGHEERMQTCDTFRDSLLIAIRPKGLNIPNYFEYIQK